MKRYPLSRRTFLALAAATCAAPALSQGPRTGKVLRIATVFDNTGIGRVNGADLYAGSKALVVRINREGGINGMPLELLMEDDNFDPALILPAARPCRRRMSTCWCAQCRWESCITR